MIVKKQKWIVSLFVIGCLFSLIAMFFVNVNYDLTEYLPGDAESRIGLEVMEREFGYPGTARVMLKDVSIYEAKQIKDQLAFMQRNQAQMQTVFDTKCDIIDRNDSKRMDTSLAIISILAIFSAWIDGYDYIATWSDVFSGSVIHLLQRILFVGVAITAGYAIFHLFGNKFRRFLSRRRRNQKK